LRNPDDILAASRHVRKRLRLDKKPKRYAKEQRGPFDRETLLSHLREARTKSWRKYKAARNHGDPTVYDYRKEFSGSWRLACEAAFGKDPIEVSKLDHKYIYDTILQFNIWTYAEYKRKRVMFPDILPSKHRLIAEWGHWNTLKECAKRHSVKLLVDDYIKLWRRLARKPTLADCREVGLVIDKAIEFYKTKKALDEMVALMRRHE